MADLRWLRRAWKQRMQVRGLRGELRATRLALERIASALEQAQPAAQVVAPPVQEGDLEISFSTPEQQQALHDAELRVFQSLGRPPTEDEVLHQFLLDSGKGT